MREYSDLEIARKYMSVASSAEARGLEFTLSLKRLRQILNCTRCYFTGEKLEKHEVNSDNYITIERLDPTKGYTDNNCVACSKMFNQKKSNLTLEDIKLMYNKLKHIL